VFVILYKLALLILWVFALPVLLLRKKTRDSVLGRWGVANQMRAWRELNPADLHWVHVASSGEFEQSIPIMEAIQAEKPGSLVMLTYFSSSARRAVALETTRRLGQSLPWHYAGYSAWDFSFRLRSLVRDLRPLSYSVMHRELWLGMLAACHAERVCCHLFATYTPTLKGVSRLWFKFCLRYFKTVTTLNLVESQLGDKLICLRDPRVERIMSRSHRANLRGWETFFNRSSTLIFASLWEKEWPLMAWALDRVWKAGFKSRVLVVPHDPNEMVVNGMLSFFKQQGQPVRRWSQFTRIPDDQTHLIVDTIGVLAELYRVADTVVVGGSFLGRVHNIIEPLVYHCRVITGPHVQNSAQAAELKALGILDVVKNEISLSEMLLKSQGQPQSAERDAVIDEYFSLHAGSGRDHARLLWV